MQTSIPMSMLLMVLGSTSLLAQTPDTLQERRFSIHAQTTVINQFKPAFSAPYSGKNSLQTKQEDQTSITSTFFAGVRLWKGASVYLNPEIAGGSGLSQALGIAAATNGETFRVGSAAPQVYLARLFYRQIIGIRSSKDTLRNNFRHDHLPDKFNQVASFVPRQYFCLTIGKIGIADIFDDNKYSHDPRTQFMSWALMSNGAWDYPANTRGYTPSVVLEYISPKNEIRYSVSLMPLTANGNKMNWDIAHATAHSLEYTHRHKLGGKDGAVRVLAFLNTANMGNYRASIAQDTHPVIENTRQYGRFKYGFAINAEQDILDDLGGFFRASWNDGNNETWAFTEIDRSISAGLVMTGQRWKRANDVVGLGYVTSGLSKPHRDYLKAGGYGFILGDGRLRYSWEHVLELYYKAELVKNKIYLSGAYQLVANPGYNADRHGAVNVFSVRLHTRL